jgi:2-hydroxy fatty acid dioxygenase
LLSAQLSSTPHIVQASNTPDLELPGDLTIPYYPINFGTGMAVLYSFLYVLMEPVAGALLAPLILGATAYSNILLDKYGSAANSWAIAIHIVSWIAQFIGHGVFEGRAPALLDNLVQACFLAPFFVWFEVLFFFGYRPELKSRLDKSVQVEIKKFKAEKQANANANGEANKMN